MRPIPHDDSLRIPEPPEDGPPFLRQNVKTVLHLKSEPKRFKQQEIKISYESFLYLKRKQNFLLVDWRKKILY